MERLFFGALLLLLRVGVFCEQICPEGSFRPGQGEPCEQCRVCDRTLRYKQNCTPTSNAVCECAPGYTCGGNCAACECGLGQQRGITGCQNCPEKSFNDRRTGKCRPWSKCPGDRIREAGTKERDVVCWSGPDIPVTRPSTSASAFPTEASEWGNQLIFIVSAFVITILVFAVCMVLAYHFLRSWVQKKFLKPFHGQLAQEVDDCTYRYPEEEEGGTCEAPPGLQGDLLEKYHLQDV